MGKSQRDKGNRGEYQLRDELRRFGYEADRVPASGAAQGFKGDVRFRKAGGVDRYAEMKSRKDSFASLYALFAAHYNEAKDDALKVVLDGGTLVNLSSSPVGALEDAGVYDHAPYLTYFEEHKRAFKRLHTLQKMVKGCDILAIKDNNRPILYLRFR